MRLSANQCPHSQSLLSSVEGKTGEEESRWLPTLPGKDPKVHSSSKLGPLPAQAQISFCLGKHIPFSWFVFFWKLLELATQIHIFSVNSPRGREWKGLKAPNVGNNVSSVRGKDQRTRGGPRRRSARCLESYQPTPGEEQKPGKAALSKAAGPAVAAPPTPARTCLGSVHCPLRQSSEGFPWSSVSTAAGRTWGSGLAPLLFSCRPGSKSLVFLSLSFSLRKRRSKQHLLLG